MRKKFFPAILLVATLFMGTWLTSCDDDDDDKVTVNTSSIVFENIMTEKQFVQSGAFSNNGGVIKPGESAVFTFHAGHGQALMFATMYGYSNDMFFAPENPGIGLFHADGTALTGDVSNHIRMWDAGTRVNQIPGPDVEHPGEAYDGVVEKIGDYDRQGNTYVSPQLLMRLVLAYNETTSEFTATITNISGGTMNETPFSPGVFAISNTLNGGLLNATPFFVDNQKADADLIPLAEAGNTTNLYNRVQSQTGIVTTLAPAIVVVYTGETNPFFTVNEKDKGNGLAKYAQTGDGADLKAALERERLVSRVYVIGDAAIAPGKSFEGRIEAASNEKVAFVTTFFHSNDWFFANNSEIGGHTRGDITSHVTLYDNGTAYNQYPGAGNRQSIFNGNNIQEDEAVSPIDNTFPVPATNQIIKVTMR